MSKKLLFTKSMNIILIFLIVLGIVVLLFGRILLGSYRKEGQNKLEAIIGQKMALDDTLFFQIDRALMSIAIDDNSVLSALTKNAVQSYDTMLQEAEYIRQISKRLISLANIYGDFYYFWLYETNTSSLIDYGSNDYKIRQAFRENISEKIRLGDIFLSQNNMWTIQDHQYIATSMKYGTVYIGAWISIEDYLREFTKLDLSDVFEVELFDDSNHRILRMKYSKNHGAYFDNQPSDTHAFGTYRVKMAGENVDSVLLFTISWGFWENTVFLQIFMIGVSLLVIFGILCCSFYIYKKVLRPVLCFYAQIHKFSANNHYKVDDKIVELDEAARMLNNLANEVYTLKMDNYVEKIRRQETELSFVKLQVKPHFYINCLNVIYSMAQLKKFEEIQALCLNISDYMRLLFRKNADKITLKQELDMVDKYLKIIQDVYGQEFQYCLTISCDIEEITVPPLVIQTFVENAVKHGGRDFEDILDIKVEINKCRRESESWICINIQDSGVGFPEKLLHCPELEGSDTFEKESQIGITNVRKRLDFYYGSQYRLIFDNNDIGALVSIEIPLK